MERFLSIHQDGIAGTLTMYDRIIFKGHLTRLFMGRSFVYFLIRQGILLKDFGAYVQKTSESV